MIFSIALCILVNLALGGKTPGIVQNKNCRNDIYPRSTLQRFTVPDGLVSWKVPFVDYKPPSYTDAKILDNPVYADLPIGTPGFTPKWNDEDTLNSKNISRKTFQNDNYSVKDDFPINPIGRTGLTGRGLLGRWGPNHAADPVVTRWKRNKHNEVVKDAFTTLPILQFVAIKRKDNDEWAIPGGMVDPGEVVSETVWREFLEEALGKNIDKNAKLTPEEQQIKKKVVAFFAKGTPVFSGYVDDPRNTDNAWMETTVYSFHDGTGQEVGQFKLKAGDDAGSVKWMDITSQTKIFANHNHFLYEVARKYQAHY